MADHAIQLVHRRGGGAAPRTREDCARLCAEHPTAYAFCSVPYPICESVRWPGMDDTTPPEAIAAVVAGLEIG